MMAKGKTRAVKKTRLTVDLNARDAERLERMATDRQETKADILRASLRLLECVKGNHDEGSTLIIRRPDGTLEQIPLVLVFG
jgi:hypothetical protein